MPDSPGEVTLLLAEWSLGRKDALARLIPFVYAELRRIAAHYMRDERLGHTLQPTALVHEAFLRLVRQERADWRSRAQFLGVASQIMRRLLVDHARRRAAAKRSSALLTFTGADCKVGAGTGNAEEVLAVDEALNRLGRLDPTQARVVELRYFGGLSVEEVAATLGISPRTVKRDWVMAKAWLRSQPISGAAV